MSRPEDIAKDLYAELDGLSAQIEQERRLPAELAEKLANLGLFRLLVPEQYGGLEVHPWSFFDTLVQSAIADASTSWNLMIGNTTSLLSASISDEWAQTMYGDNPNVVTVGVTAPIGRAEEVEGGLKVTGRWPFGSGCTIAQWICGGCTLSRDGETVLNDHGLPATLLAFFPADEVTIHDTWHTSGLNGTGSHDIEVTEAFVPEGRWAILGNRARIDAPLYRFPTLGLLALGVSAVSIGIAERAIREFTELADSKKPTGSNRALAKRTSAQADIARAIAQVESAKALTKKYIDEAMEPAAKGERMSMQQKANLRLAAANNAWSAADAVDRLYHAAGGSAIYRSNKLQQCFRDVHVTTQHIMVGQPLFEVTGKVALGIDPGQPL